MHKKNYLTEYALALLVLTKKTNVKNLSLNSRPKSVLEMCGHDGGWLLERKRS